MSKPSPREQRQARARQKRLKANFVRGGIITAVAFVILYLGWIILRPQVGEAIPVLASGHTTEGQVVSFNSDPPTSGDHYPTTLPAQFYHEADLAGLPSNPEGYLVHNLEHGYIIFWYNCTLVDDCEGLKNQIQTVMDEMNGVKLVAFPSDALDAPVVMTSWGRRQAFDVFDPEAARTFILRNRNRAPEPTAP
ncbi:MAG: hypothetical protein Fur0022_01700 [Anaerolineales bacterium]